MTEELLRASDEEIEAFVADADPMTLRGLLHQLTADPAMAATPVGEVPTMYTPISALTDPAAIATVRRAAVGFLRAHRDRGAPEIDPGPRDRLRTSIELALGETLPDAAVELCLEELALDHLPRRHELRAPAPAADEFSVVVIGAGIGGISAAIHLRECGIAFTVIEKNAGVGGCWHDNEYPGCRVDVPSRAYSHTFGVGYPWRHWFAPRAENNDYLQWCVDTYGVREHIRLDTEVTALTWDEASSRWRIDLVGADGRTESMTANAVISAVGFLSRPRLPEIEGMGDFEGPAFHTAWWDGDVEVEGKRFAVIGTGCSGMQLVPELERLGAEVTVFQRSASWLLDVPIYRDELPEGVRWLGRNMPYFRNFEKLRAVWMVGDHIAASWYMKDPDWDDPDSVSAITASARQVALEHLERKLGDRPDLLAACTPDSPILASRPVVDNGWLDAIAGPRVELVTEAVTRIVPEGVVTGSGRTVEVDAVVYATGFQASKYLWPMEVTGRDGTLEELWAEDGARAHLGIAMPGFPNLFCIYGPNTNSNQGTLPTMGAELQTRFAIQCIDALLTSGATAIEVTREAYDASNRRLDERLASTIYADPRLQTYYVNEHGRSSTQSGWSTLEYWTMTRSPDPAHFRLTGAPLTTGETSDTISVK
jgi:4-hydroxyacetophenone monooxygenase